MNIFILDNDMSKNVEFYVNKHIVKMPLESVQILSTVVRLSGIDAGYKITHVNHPCVKWANNSLSNWRWLKELVYYLNEEWQYRYDHTNNHKSYEKLLTLPEPNINDIGLTPFAICMDNDSKINNNPVECYRKYYNTQKRHLFDWKKRNIPYWIDK